MALNRRAAAEAVPEAMLRQARGSGQVNSIPLRPCAPAPPAPSTISKSIDRYFGCLDPVPPPHSLPPILPPQLNISGRGLTSIPGSVLRINLDVGKGQEIDLSGAGDSWWEQVELSKLFVPTNALTEIPAEIANLPALVTLDAHDNRVSERAAEGEAPNPESVALCSEIPATCKSACTY